MVSILQAIVLGIVQGITEWLPISSSGHLVLFQHLFGMKPPIFFDIILHFGSFLVVLIVFWKDIKELFIGLLKRDPKKIRFAMWLFIASIPIGLVGVFLNGPIKSIFNELSTVGYSLLFTAFVLFMSRYPLQKVKNLGLGNTAIMGIAQAAAILPGVSRSGITISTGLMQGVKREEAARFSFLLFIPAILGATIFELKDVSAITDIGALLIGTVFAVISGVISLKLLLKIIKDKKFSYFSIYCLVLGIVLLSVAYA